MNAALNFACGLLNSDVLRAAAACGGWRACQVVCVCRSCSG
ncbi:hypothetical protein [Saccharopolyspora rosea]